MRLDIITVKAKNCPMDVFVYLPKEGRFFFVDDKDVLDDGVLLYHESGINKRGLNEYTLWLPLNKKIQIISSYQVTPETVML